MIMFYTYLIDLFSPWMWSLMDRNRLEFKCFNCKLYIAIVCVCWILYYRHFVVSLHNNMLVLLTEQEIWIGRLSVREIPSRETSLVKNRYGLRSVKVLLHAVSMKAGNRIYAFPFETTELCLFFGFNKNKERLMSISQLYNPSSCTVHVECII